MTVEQSVHFYEHDSEEYDFLEEITSGLLETPKRLSPKFFYDEKGSQLFTEITRQPEYYLTRTEVQLLNEYADEIRSLIGDDFTLIEYGSGSSEKIRILLEQLRPSIYAPVDISRDYLAQAAKALAAEYPWLEVHATCADFTSGFSLPFKNNQRRVAFFPGSSIGNFERSEAASFLKRIRKLVGDRGSLLLGVDLVKDVDTLNRAYNDEAGVTAEFNLNILQHLNREYGADFDAAGFEHQAFFNEQQSCIQMFLVSQREQSVRINGDVVNFVEGEKIHTENSHKYTREQVVRLAASAGFSNVRDWTDKDELFGLYYLYNES